MSSLLLTPSNQTLLLHFLLGSSFIPTAIPLIRLAASGKAEKVIDNYASKSLFIPILFGLASVLATTVSVC